MVFGWFFGTIWRIFSGVLQLIGAGRYKYGVRLAHTGNTYSNEAI